MWHVACSMQNGAHENALNVSYAKQNAQNNFENINDSCKMQQLCTKYNNNKK